MALQNTPYIGTGVIDKTYTDMKSGVDTSTYRPYTMDQMDVDDGLEQRIFWETTLRMTAVLNDVFEKSLTEVAGVTGKGLSIPNSVGIKLTGQGQSGVYTFPILDPLVGSPRAGTAENLMGYERGQRMRYTSAYYNEIKDGVIQETYGVNYNKIEIFGMYQQITSQLNNFWREVKGRMKRECLVEWTNVENTKAGSAAPGKHLNPNWIVAGTATKPTWSPTLATFKESVCDALVAGAGANGTLDIATLDRVQYEAENSYIEPLEDGTYTFVVPTPLWYKLSAVTGGLGGLWKDTRAYTTDTIVYPNEVGMYRKLRIIPDDRWVGAKVGGVDGSWTLAFEYVQPGGKAGDNRDKLAYAVGNKTFQLGFLLGKGAFIERVVKDLFFKEEETEYGKIKAMGSFMEYGCTLNVIRTDANTGGFPAVADNRGSFVVAFPGATV